MSEKLYVLSNEHGTAGAPGIVFVFIGRAAAEKYQAAHDSAKRLDINLVEGLVGINPEAPDA